MASVKCSSESRKVVNAKRAKNGSTYCDIINEALKISKWFQGDSCNNSSLVLKSIKMFYEHLEANCKCIAKGSNTLLLACDFYQLFLVRLKKFNMKIETEDAKYNNKFLDKLSQDTSAEDDETRLTPASNSNCKKPSKYDSYALPYYVNFASQSSLLKPLKQCIKCFKETFSHDEPDVQIKLIQGLKINAMLISCYYIFSCYHLFDYQYQTVKILIDINMRIMPEEKEALLTAYHLMIKLYLENGALGKAQRYLKLSQALLKVMKKKNFETFESALIYLDKCEIDLRLGKIKQSSESIKTFLNSEYLNRLTLNRYYLKGLALTIASQFSPSQYSYSDSFQEFIEPVQIAVCILKRWHRPYFVSPSDNKPKEILENIDVDPIWYRFAIYDFAFKAFSIANAFYLNIGFPLDIVLIFNAFMKIIRQNCFLNNLLSFLMTGAKLDIIYSKNDYSTLKLKEALCCIDSKHIPKFSNSVSSLKSDFEENGSVDLLSSPLKSNTKLVNSLSKELLEDHLSQSISSQSMPDQEYDCAHQNPLSVFDVKKVLCERLDSSDSVDEAYFNFANLKLPNYENYVYPVNILILELFTQLSTTQKQAKCETESKLKEILSNLPTFFASVMKQIGKAIQLDPQDINLNHISTIILFKMKMIDLLSDCNDDKKDWSATIYLLRPFLSSIEPPFFQFEIRSLIGHLLFKYINAKVNLANFESSIIEYDSLTVDGKMSQSMNNVQCRTPSPVNKKRLQSTKTKVYKAPNAPKNRVKYKMDEFKDYIQGLSKNYDKSQAPLFKMGSLHSSCESDENDVMINKNSSQYLDNDDKIFNSKISKEESSSKIIKLKSKNVVKPSQKEHLHNNNNNNNNGGDNNEDDVLSESLQRQLIIDPDLNQDIDHKLLDKIKNEDKNDIIYFIDLLKLLLQLYENHPPCHLYAQIHQLLFNLYSSTQLVNMEAATYHLSESVRANSLRYRGLFTSEKKKNAKLKMKLDTSLMMFQSKRDSNYHNMNDLLEKVSNEWRLVQVFSISNGLNSIPDLIINRIQKGKKSIFLKIKGNNNKFTRNFMDELFEIIEMSNASIVNREAQSFWKARYALNDRFNLLLQSVDNAWLGPFKGILMGQSDDANFITLCDQIKINIKELMKEEKCQDETLLEMLIESFSILSKEQFNTALALIYNLFDSKLLNDCYFKCENTFHNHYSNAEKSSIFETLSLKHVGLILNQDLDLFPFESLPSLALIRQEIFRIPSIRFLSILLKAYECDESVYKNNVQQDQTYYVINPANNLSKTEHRFKEKFLKKSDWKGVIGKAPKGEDLKSYLESKDLYIFFGHGAGSAYYRSIPDGLEGMSIRAAALVIGCCSGKLFTDGKNCDSFGMPYKFILNGCPSYVGVLWDVTDRDIDKFADRVMFNWIPGWESETGTISDGKYPSLCKSVVMARSVCKLVYLIGAATVIYGLPVSMAK